MTWGAEQEGAVDWEIRVMDAGIEVIVDESGNHFVDRRIWAVVLREKVE